MNDDSGIWIPEAGVNTIETLNSGEGFYAFVNEDVTFQYTAGDGFFVTDAGRSMKKESSTASESNTPELVKTGLPWALLVSIDGHSKGNDVAGLMAKPTSSFREINSSGQVRTSSGASHSESNGWGFSKTPTSSYVDAPAIIEVYDGDLLVGRALIDDAHSSVAADRSGTSHQEPGSNKNFTSSRQTQGQINQNPLDKRGLRAKPTSSFSGGAISWQVPVICWQGSDEHGLPGFTAGNPVMVRVISSAGEVITEYTGGKFGNGPYGEIRLSLNGASDPRSLPTAFEVEKAYPNPFNPSVTVPFAFPGAGEVQFAVYNLLGQEVYNSSGIYQAGRHSFVFDASTTGADLVSGMYFLQVQYSGQVSTRKVMLLK